MTDWLEIVLSAGVPALLPSIVAVWLGIQGWRRNDLKHIEKQLGDLSRDVGEIKGAMPHVRDRLATLEAGRRR